MQRSHVNKATTQMSYLLKQANVRMDIHLTTNMGAHDTTIKRDIAQGINTWSWRDPSEHPVPNRYPACRTQPTTISSSWTVHQTGSTKAWPLWSLNQAFQMMVSYKTSDFSSVSKNTTMMKHGGRFQAPPIGTTQRVNSTNDSSRAIASDHNNYQQVLGTRKGTYY